MEIVKFGKNNLDYGSVKFSNNNLDNIIEYGIWKCEI
jgi:hypothetical protein